MSYQIISASSTEDLERSIKRFLKDGYILAGGVAFDNENKKYMQAVYMRL